MKFNMNLIWRFLAWLAVATFEAVIGLPWLTLFLALNWLLPLSFETTFVVLILLTLVIAALYSLPLFLAGLVLIGLWQLWERLKLKSIWWLVSLIVAASFIIWWHQTTINLFTVGYSLLVCWLIFRLKGGKLFLRSWQKTHLPFLSKS